MISDAPLFCLICSTADKPRRATPGYRTCDRCADRIREALDEIPGLYATLGEDEAFLPVVNPGGRRGPGFGYCGCEYPRLWPPRRIDPRRSR